MHWWPEPTAGDIVWCHFPDDVHPRPRARPGLLIETREDDDGLIFVIVAYGTSQKTDRLYRGECRIARQEHPAACAAAGLSYDTTFNLGKVLELPCSRPQRSQRPALRAPGPGADPHLDEACGNEPLHPWSPARTGRLSTRHPPIPLDWRHGHQRSR
jgi:hypothetical protein